METVEFVESANRYADLANLMNTAIGRRLSAWLLPSSRRSAACRRDRRPMSVSRPISYSPCQPSDEALQQVVQGPDGLVSTARPEQVVVEASMVFRCRSSSGDCAARGKGATFIDGEVEAPPAWSRRVRVSVFPRRVRRACRSSNPLSWALRVHAFTRSFGAASQGQAHQRCSGRDSYRRHSRGDGAWGEGRRRRQSDDQGDRQRQWPLDQFGILRRGWRNGASSRCKARIPGCSTHRDDDDLPTALAWRRCSTGPRSCSSASSPWGCPTATVRP